MQALSHYIYLPKINSLNIFPMYFCSNNIVILSKVVHRKQASRTTCGDSERFDVKVELYQGLVASCCL